jgi:hypothetical protein
MAIDAEGLGDAPSRDDFDGMALPILKGKRVQPISFAAGNG